jgi:hypothetical protein
VGGTETVKLKEAERHLGESIEVALERHGFSREGRLDFLRRAEGHVDRIGFSVFADRIGGIRASCGVGLRFPTVETWRPGDRNENAPTVAVPLHFLEPNRKYVDWVLSEVTDWPAFGRDVVEIIERRALPFLDRYSSLDVVRAALESSDPRDWFTLDPTSRIVTLALTHCASGEVDRGVTLLDKTLGDLIDAPMKARYPLMRLKDSLRARQASAST